MKLAECHPSRKAHARGLCGACYQKWRHENKPDAHEKYKAYQRELSKTEKHKERLRAHRRSKDPKYVRSRRCQNLRKKYGITADQYDEMLAAQGGGCAICTRKPGKGPLHVDHCHDTGAVRGILCHQCNWYLGTIEASEQVRDNFLNYLKEADGIKQRKAEQSKGCLRNSQGPDVGCADECGGGAGGGNA